MTKADCPACGAKVNVNAKPKMGQKVVCTACKADLEVVWLEPVELDFPFDENDYEDDEDEDYDDD